ncbi:hypothetical protein GCM10025865_09950 [Paraoerskovia sediminicola]|uniref:Transporter n=1 Tax=Paraoerskovia sediminicola TaxID=1138587 RepID=A0ABM8G1A5_9CELL|nr:hypothetical protein [Paraoerskovia sediminicola]BDZ41696.1 hypothetical protein GCM10025865_09950 [Paraoerskovia sediminicola]
MPTEPDAEPEPADRRETDDAPLDPAESLRLIRDQQQRAGALIPDGRLLYLVWGAAWLLGFVVLWGSSRTGGGAGFAWTPDAAEVPAALPAGWAFAVYSVLIAAAIAVTIVHSVRRGAGVRGPSARTGALYGWSWFLGFLVMALLVAGIASSGASADVVARVANGSACLVVGMAYLMSALLWEDLRLYVLGAWILLVGGVASLFGLPATYLVMALAGGGGFLVMAAVAHLAVVRGRREEREAPRA